MLLTTRSAIHGDKRKFFLFPLLVMVFFLSGGVKEANSQVGYMGLSNQISVGLFNAAYQGGYQLEYKRSLTKHLGLILDAGYFATKKSYGHLSDNAARGFDPVSSRTTGPIFGVGIGRNKKKAGMAYPVGYCVTYGAKMAFLDIVDRYNDMKAPLRYKNTVVQTYVRLSRTYSVWDQWTLQLGVKTGFRIGRVQFQGSQLPKKKFSPLRVVPARHPFSKGGTYQLQKFDIGGKNAWHLLFMPLVRVGYMW